MAKLKKKQSFVARIYMQLAVEEMNKSINEPRPDGKVPPKVGAILLFPDGRIERAHRGELRDGDHAEFTLIERKLAYEKLDDCILFTTLEPCVERNLPKIACCKRTSNARIKTVYVGIPDPDPTVNGKGIAHLQDKGIKVIMFDRNLQKLIEQENEQFIEQALERKRKSEEKTESTIEKPVTSADFNELSTEALEKFIKEAKLPYKTDQLEFKRYLRDLGALEYDKKSKQLKPTGYGILLFGLEPRVIYKQAALKCAVDYGYGNIETREFDQALVLVPDLVQEWIRKVLPSSKDTTSFKRKEIPAFPIEVLREAVINAIVHRDYNIEGAKSQLEINQDKIAIKSPGGPLPSISLEQLNSFKAPSISRNPIITFVFNKMKLVEEMGFGMEAMKSLNKKYDLPLPEYNYAAPFLTLTFPRTMEAVRIVSQHDGIDQLSQEELKGYEWVKAQDEIATKDYAKHFEYTQRTASRHITNMLRLGLLKDNGEPQKSPKIRYSIK